MKVLFVQPPIHDPAMAFSYATEPLGMETIAGSVPDHDVDLVDLRFSKEPLVETLRRERPDVIATGGYTVNYYDVVDIVREAKRTLPGVRTVVGGHHASVQMDDFALPEVDAVVLGMGEETFPELVSAWASGEPLSDVAGLALMDGDRLRATAARAMPRDLDASPMPRRDINAPHRKRYRAFGRPIGLLNTSRGCPFRCTFCSITHEMGNRYLTKSPARVIEELSEVPQRFVRFADGNTFGSPKRARELAVALSEARLGKTFMVDARADTIVRSPQLFEAWKRAGLRIVAIGMEAANEAALERLGKDSHIQDNIDAIEILRETGLEVIGQFMVDPDFDERDFDELLEFVLRHRIHYPSFTIATPFLGTEMYHERASRIVTTDRRRYDCWHAVTVPRLGWERFYRRYIDLYEICYGPRRVADSLRQQLDPAQRRAAASPLILGAVALQIRVSRPRLERAYGIRRDLRWEARR